MTQNKSGVHTGILAEMLIWWYTDDGKSIKETIGKVYSGEPTMSTMQSDVIAHTGCENTKIVAHALTNWEYAETMNGCPAR